MGDNATGRPKSRPRLRAGVMRGLVVGLAAASTACVTAAGFQPGSAAPIGSGSPTASDRVVFHPRGPAAEKYSTQENEEESSSFVGDVLALARELGAELPTWDNRLARAARELAQVLPENGSLPHPWVEFALHHVGIIEPAPRLRLVLSDAPAASALVETAGRELAALLGEGRFQRVGIGIAQRESGHAMVIAVQESHLELEALAKQHHVGEQVTMRGHLLHGFMRPQVLVADARGGVEEVPTRGGARDSFLATITCGSGGVRVEVLGQNARGPQVLANFVLHCGQALPAVVTAPSRAGAHSMERAALENRLVALINRSRVEGGLPPLAVDPLVAEVARTYSEEMVRTGEVVHVSGESGAAEDRLARAGSHPTVVQENLARSESVDSAHTGLLNSPGHRANIFSREATHVGVGIAVAPVGDLLITELFVRLPLRLNAAELRARVVERLATAHQIRGHRDLQRMAQAHAERLAAQAGETISIAGTSGFRVPKGFAGVRVMSTTIANVDELAALDWQAAHGATHAGVGVVAFVPQGPREQANLVVILLGQPR